MRWVMKMIRAAAWAAASCMALTAATAGADSHKGPPRAGMTAEQIVNRNIEVRGGFEAWSKIQTIIWAGHLESERSPVPSLPFQLKEKRPDMSRFEITEPSQRSLRVFNGVGGWKMKLGADGKPEVKPLTAQEVKFARAAPGLEGPLVDYRARGSTIELEGDDEIDGRKDYRIGVTLASGEHQTVWIDAESFLDSRFDRTAYSQNGSRGVITVRYRDYKEVQGLALPSLIEIGGAAASKPDRMVIERVALNAAIPEREFAGMDNPRNQSESTPR
jgi:hypothetical protein